MRFHLFHLGLLVAVLAVAPGWSASTYFQDRPDLTDSTSHNSLAPMSTLDLLRLLIFETRAKMFQNYQRNGIDQTKKRAASSSCLFNAGLAHNCDYRDVIGAVNEVNHWGSDLAPGRRKRDVSKISTVDLFNEMIKQNRINPLDIQ